MWTRMNDGWSRVRVGRVKFKVGEHVTITREKLNSQRGRN